MMLASGFLYYKMTQCLKDIRTCWNQLSVFNHSMETVSREVGELKTRVEHTEDEIEETGNRVSMACDYSQCIHFSLVDMGGVVEHRELSQENWNHLLTMEQGNLVARNVMGTKNYLNLVRSGVGYQEGECTDSPNLENGEEEVPTADETVEANALSERRRSDTPRSSSGVTGPYPAPVTLQVQIDGLRREMAAAVQSGDNRRVIECQGEILNMLNMMHERDPP